MSPNTSASPSHISCETYRQFHSPSSDFVVVVVVVVTGPKNSNYVFYMLLKIQIFCRLQGKNKPYVRLNGQFFKILTK